MANYEINAGTLFEGFESSEDWTASAGSVANDTTYVKTGTNSLKATVTAGQASSLFSKTIEQSFASVGVVSFWVYVPDISYFSSSWLIIYLSSQANWSSFYTASFTSRLHEGWNKLTIGKDQWATSNGESWSNTMVKLGFRVYSDSTNANIVYFDSLYINEQARPKCIITFDDGWDSSYTYGYQHMRKLGLKGTAYIIQDLVDTENYCTTAQLQEMFDYGWDICSHHQTDFTTLSQAEMETELQQTIGFIQGNGWSRNNSELHFAYPNGGYNDTVLAAMTAKNMLTGRTIINRTQANFLDNDQLLCRQSILNTTTLAAAKAFIDRTISDGGAILLNFHKIEPETADASTEVLQADFEDLMDYLYIKSPSIDVVTLTEWYRGLTQPRRLV